MYIYKYISDWINGSARLRVELKLFDSCSQCYSLSLLSLRAIPWTISYSKTEISPHRRYCSPFIRCSRQATFQLVFSKIILLDKDIPPQTMRACSSLPISHNHLAKRAHFCPNWQNGAYLYVMIKREWDWSVYTKVWRSHVAQTDSQTSSTTVERLRSVTASWTNSTTSPKKICKPVPLL